MARKWVKLWESYWTSASHADVGADALLVGTALMSLMRWEPGDVEASAVNEAGAPYSMALIAGRTQLTVQRVRVAIGKLVEVGTVAWRDNVITMPQFGSWQETPDAARKRKVRTHDAGQSGGQSADAGLDIPREAEAEAEAEDSPSARPPKSPRGKSPSPDDLALLAAIDAARSSVGLRPLPQSGRTTATIQARRRDGATQDELLAVLGAFHRLAQRDASKATMLCATSPFTGQTPRGPGGWSWGLSLLDQERLGAPVSASTSVTYARRPARGPAAPSPRPAVSGEVELDAGDR